MKKLLLFSGVLLFSAASVSAQITITQSDVPQPGSQASMAVDLTGNFTPQAASATAQIWNYAALTNTQTNGYFFVSPSSTPYSNAFPSSTLADSVAYASGDTYFVTTPSGFFGTGYGESKDGYPVALTLHPYYEQIPLPATYGATDGGISRGDSEMAINYMGFDSGKANIVIQYADTVDAWGTMTTPYGTYNVIRQKHYDVTIDSILVHSHLGWIVYEANRNVTYMYRWYANNFSYYFATMQMDHTNTHDSIVQWFNGFTAGINNISSSHYTTVYPNPCQTQLTFNCSSPVARQITVFDMTGRQLSEQEIRNGMLIMNTSSFPAGMYFYRVSDNSGNVLDRGKFIVQ